MTASKRGSRPLLLALIGAMTALGPLGTDLYLPGLPAVTHELESTESLTQLTLMAYLLGLGLGHFLWGPVCDRLGRRGPLMLGLACFILAGAVCALTPNMEVLLAARLAQGLAGSAGIVISRAIVRDLYEGRELTRVFGWLAMVFGLAPIIGPLLGAGVIQFAGWRGTFWALAGLGVVFLALTAAILPETLTEERRTRGTRAERRGAWTAPLANRAFVTNSLLLLASSIVMFGYVSYIPFVLQTERGIDDVTFAWLFALNAVAVLTGGQLAALLARRVDGRTVLRTAYAIAIGAGTLVLLAIALDWPDWALLAALWVTILQIAIVQPTAIALAIAPFAQGAGTASAIAGGTQFLGAAIVTSAVTSLFGADGTVMGVLILSAVTVACGIAIVGPLLRGRNA